jgi:hypothetical protein
MREKEGKNANKGYFKPSEAKLKVMPWSLWGFIIWRWEL